MLFHGVQGAPVIQTLHHGQQSVVTSHGQISSTGQTAGLPNRCLTTPTTPWPIKCEMWFDTFQLKVSPTTACVNPIDQPSNAHPESLLTHITSPWRLLLINVWFGTDIDCPLLVWVGDNMLFSLPSQGIYHIWWVKHHWDSQNWARGKLS